MKNYFATYATNLSCQIFEWSKNDNLIKNKVVIFSEFY